MHANEAPSVAEFTGPRNSSENLDFKSFVIQSMFLSCGCRGFCLRPLSRWIGFYCISHLYSQSVLIYLDALHVEFINNVNDIFITQK